MITRFAPSPTGYLHVGGLRTALYSYLLSKKMDGKFLLRIEDTDRQRFVADGTINILKSLNWASLDIDEGVKLDNLSDPDQPAVFQEGKNGPYIQSERLEIYKEHVQKLLDEGNAYYCFCTPGKLQQVREEKQKNNLPPGYDGHCRNLSKEEIDTKIKAGEKYVIRMKMPKEGETAFDDLIRGKVVFKNEAVDDQVILKSDGYPTYHLASVVDDRLMEITHVVRGEEWISSTPKHIQLYKFFGWEIPLFAHLPLLLNSDKSKLSKRQGDVAVEDYRKKGYLPEALINFVAFLGWNPSDDREIFSLDELVKEFSLEKVGKAGAVFNLDKLNWYNKEYLKKLEGEDLIKICLPWVEKLSISKSKLDDKIWLEKLFNLEKVRINSLNELAEVLSFVFELPDYAKDLLKWKKGTLEQSKENLILLKEFWSNIESWENKNIEEKTITWIKKNNHGVGDILWPVRMSLSGQENSPGPFEIAGVLGKEETFKRIDTAVSKI